MPQKPKAVSRKTNFRLEHGARRKATIQIDPALYDFVEAEARRHGRSGAWLFEDIVAWALNYDRSLIVPTDDRPFVRAAKDDFDDILQDLMQTTADARDVGRKPRARRSRGRR